MVFYILGTIAALCFLLLVIKYPLRILKLNKAGVSLMSAHEAASAGVFVIGIAKIIISAVKRSSVSVMVKISGLAAYTMDIIIIAACHMTKDVVKKMRDHRIFSLIAFILTALHIVLVILSVSGKKSSD